LVRTDQLQEGPAVRKVPVRRRGVVAGGGGAEEVQERRANAANKLNQNLSVHARCQIVCHEAQVDAACNEGHYDQGCWNPAGHQVRAGSG
jgi:hypothetical protein